MSGHGHGGGKPAWHHKGKGNWKPGYDSPENEGVPQPQPPPRKEPGPAPNNHYVGEGPHRQRRRFDPTLKRAARRKRLIALFWKLWLLLGIIAWMAGAPTEIGLAIGAGGPILLLIALIIPGG